MIDSDRLTDEQKTEVKESYKAQVDSLIEHEIYPGSVYLEDMIEPDVEWITDMLASDDLDEHDRDFINDVAGDELTRYREQLECFFGKTLDMDMVDVSVGNIRVYGVDVRSYDNGDKYRLCLVDCDEKNTAEAAFAVADIDKSKAHEMGILDSGSDVYYLFYEYVDRYVEPSSVS